MYQMFRQAGRTGPVAATGIHAELLAEIDLAARALIKFVALERSGEYDGLGRTFWTRTDPVLDTARKLVALTEKCRAELRDAGPPFRLTQ